MTIELKVARLTACIDPVICFQEKSVMLQMACSDWTLEGLKKFPRTDISDR